MRPTQHPHVPSPFECTPIDRLVDRLLGLYTCTHPHTIEIESLPVLQVKRTIIVVDSIDTRGPALLPAGWMIDRMPVGGIELGIELSTWDQHWIDRVCPPLPRRAHAQQRSGLRAAGFVRMLLGSYGRRRHHLIMGLLRRPHVRKNIACSLNVPARSQYHTHTTPQPTCKQAGRTRDWRFGTCVPEPFGRASGEPLSRFGDSRYGSRRCIHVWTPASSLAPRINCARPRSGRYRAQWYGSGAAVAWGPSSGPRSISRSESNQQAARPM